MEYVSYCNVYKLFNGGFECRRRCGRPPYDRLLNNPVLRADYHATIK